MGFLSIWKGVRGSSTVREVNNSIPMFIWYTNGLNILVYYFIFKFTNYNGKNRFI